MLFFILSSSELATTSGILSSTELATTSGILSSTELATTIGGCKTSAPLEGSLLTSLGCHIFDQGCKVLARGGWLGLCRQTGQQAQVACSKDVCRKGIARQVVELGAARERARVEGVPQPLLREALDGHRFPTSQQTIMFMIFVFQEPCLTLREHCGKN